MEKLGFDISGNLVDLNLLDERECKYHGADIRCRCFVHKGVILPAKHVAIAYWNLIEGKDWDICSPIYFVTRKQAAFIFTEYTGVKKPQGRACK